LKPANLETVEIESLAYGGEGIGHIQKKVIFVPLTAPGDRVRVKISENKRNYLRGTLEEFELRSLQRAVPLCDYFGDCGGCHWQHIQYPFQLDAKAKILQDSLARIGKVQPSEYEWLPPIHSPKAYGYRCRVRLQCHSQSKVVLGFFRAHSRDVVPVERCELLPPFLNEILRKLRDFLNSLDYLHPFTEIEILADPDREEAVLAFQTASGLGEFVTDFLKALKTQIPKVYGVTLEVDAAEQKRNEDFGNCALDVGFNCTSAATQEPTTIAAKMRIHTFSQVNLEQNQNLHRIICEWAEPSQDKTVLDIYCGMGNLSLPLARRVNRVIGLENNPHAVEDAGWNARRNGFENCEYRLTDVEDGLSTLQSELTPVDVAIVDPPRKGAKEAVRKIVALRPSKVLYVSCNPTTLARDIELFAYSNYRLKKIQMLDMFPQTFHIECVAELAPPSSCTVTG